MSVELSGYEIHKSLSDKTNEQSYHTLSQISSCIDNICKEQYRLTLPITLIDNILDFNFFNDIAEELFVMAQNQYIKDYQSQCDEVWKPSRSCRYPSILNIPFLCQNLEELVIENLNQYNTFRVSSKLLFNTSRPRWNTVHHIEIINNNDSLIIFEWCPAKQYYHGNFVACVANNCGCFNDDKAIVRWHACKVRKNRYRWIPHQNIKKKR